MRILIDIPDIELAEKGHWYTDTEMVWTVVKAVQNGTPIPDNATNGEVVKLIFDEEDIWDIHTALNLYDDTRNWWNSPYQKGGKNEN